MKPVFVKKLENKLSENLCFTAIYDLSYSDTTFHYHEECQLVHVLEGSGRRIVADNVSDFRAGDLTLLGSGVPHLWQSGQEQARCLVLYFSPTALLKALASLGSTDRIAALFNKSRRGMELHGYTRRQITGLLHRMQHLEGLPQMTVLLEILQLLSATPEFHFIASEGYMMPEQYKDNERLDLVLRYIFEHFTEDIPLSTVAGMVNMNTQAFCRFFKTHTQKTFVDFLTEVRIAHACKLLSYSYNDITGLAFECGFNNVSNFNRCFKLLKGITPREYRKRLSFAV